jgi:lysyl-tRNA synthetase class 2
MRRLTTTSEWTKARDIVERHGRDTLSYFTLRDDKHHWFWRGTVVAYAVHNGVCLVSPDPVGPVDERHDAWRAFRRFADEHGWPVAVMGAGEEWRSVYRETGMRDLYIGDEAIVDVRTFCLDGGRMKGLRQAVNRIEKYGYRIEFRDPSELEPDLEVKLRALMTESRRGEVERGFSMTLGRVFCPEDRGLLMAVCFGPDGEPAAFCQYVPSADIDGYSLDLMRRSERGDHWNGVTDYVVVRTIEYLRAEGHGGLGLNFAVMRSVLAEKGSDGIGHRIERRVLGWLSESMQIESLWKYNAKFDPDWRPRYAVYDTAENFLSSAVAVAKAESFWDLPVIGRFFAPDDELVASEQ